MDRSFWKGNKVFVTGHTGFKGSWLVMMLRNSGAIVSGYSREIPTSPSIFETCNIASLLEHDFRGDISDAACMAKSLEVSRPEILFHLAAQPLVRASYKDPFETYQTNVMGTLTVLMQANQTESLKTIVNITTDKCYDNKEWSWGYREIDPLGGHDPYSSSKACADILAESIRKSFLEKNSKLLASARAGNVIGGGDFADDRIVPDFMRAYFKNETLKIRNPFAVRPWQHVMEPLLGYIMLAEKLHKDGSCVGAWNFGPEDRDCRSVQYVVDTLLKCLPDHSGVEITGNLNQPHEAQLLKLDCSKAKSQLGWTPRLELADALKLTADWYRSFKKKEDMYAFSLGQIESFLAIKES